MQQALDAMKVALRVLTAASERSDPQPADLQSLLQYAPQLAGMPADELACEVVRIAIEKRSAARGNRV